MDLEAVSEELRSALATIAGLRTPPWGVGEVQVPAAVVTLPERVDFDETYGRGKDRYPDLQVVVLVGAPEERASIKTLAKYVAGSGPKSVKAVLEAFTWTTCDSVTVTSADFPRATYAGTPYLAAAFHLDIIGKGA
jgi:hypothetical protein